MNLQKQNYGALLLGLTSFLWGMAFVVQSAVADRVPPFWLNALRCSIGALFLGALLLLRRWLFGRRVALPKGQYKRLLPAGVICGGLLFCSISLQQFGLLHYPQGVAAEARGGFLTALYVVFVPLGAWLFGRRLQASLAASVFLALGGTALLCRAAPIAGFYLGDLLILGCALCFAGYIFAVDHFSRGADGIRLAFAQFAVCAVFSGLLSLLSKETPSGDVRALLPAILYLGLGATGIGYTLQIFGQRRAEPTVASLVMSMEGVFAALGGWIFLGNRPTAWEAIGCGLIFLATVTAQLPMRRSEKYF